jgi:hypothetical protein
MKAAVCQQPLLTKEHFNGIISYRRQSKKGNIYEPNDKKRQAKQNKREISYPLQKREYAFYYFHPAPDGCD